MENIADIIKGCQRRDIQSQKKLYIKYYGTVKICIRHYVKDMDMVNDLTHECFLKIFDKINTYSGSGSFDGWIKKMASNIAIDYYRKNERAQDYVHLEDVSESYTEPEKEDSIISQIEEIVTIDFLQKSIDMLPFQLKMVFILFVIEKRNHEEIAKELSISIPNSRKRLQTARKWLKEYLINYHNEKVESAHGK